MLWLELHNLHYGLYIHIIRSDGSFQSIVYVYYSAVGGVHSVPVKCSQCSN